jgi:hypothetical protein
MTLLKTKKAVAVLAALVVAGVAAFGAYAYFTTTASSTVTLHGTTASALYPGTSSTVNFTVDNSSSGNQYVGTVHLVSVSTDAAHSSCNLSDFTMPDVVVNHDFAGGTGQTVTATGTLSMADNGNQDACQGAPLTLHLPRT